MRIDGAHQPKNVLMKLELKELETDLLTTSCEYALLVPENGGEGLPLLYLLHGGGGSRDMLAHQQLQLETAINDGVIDPVVVATPSAGISYYMDDIDGKERWETLLMTELRDDIRQQTGADVDRLLVIGFSMGGAGSLRLAFRNPNHFVGVASLEAGVDPFLRLEDMPDWYAMTVSERIDDKFGDPVDEDFWAKNNPANIAANDPDRLIESGLKIMLEVGTHDGLFNHHNVEFLHRVLFDHGIKHEYRTVLGANHIGQSMPDRMRAALSFLNVALNPPPPDTAADAFSAQMVEGMRAMGIEPPPF